MPTKIYRIKMNDFWINVSYSPPHYPRLQQTYCEHDYGSRYWIWMNSSEMSESLRGGKGAASVILEKGLVVIWRHLSHFWHLRFLCFFNVGNEEDCS